MNYEMTPGKLKTQDPSLLVKRLCIEQKNSPCFVLPDNKWSKPFLYTFSCECDGLWVEFDFEHPDRIEYGQYTWPEAVEKWLIPHLAKRPNVEHNRRTADSSPGVRVDGPVGPHGSDDA